MHSSRFHASQPACNVGLNSHLISSPVKQVQVPLYMWGKYLRLNFHFPRWCSHPMLDWLHSCLLDLFSPHARLTSQLHTLPVPTTCYDFTAAHLTCSHPMLTSQLHTLPVPTACYDFTAAYLTCICTWFGGQGVGVVLPLPFCWWCPFPFLCNVFLDFSHHLEVSGIL